MENPESETEENVTIKTIDARFYRTRPCRYYMAGLCNRGSTCTFIHQKIQVVDSENPLTCKFFLSGMCNKGAECRFIHPNLERTSSNQTSEHGDAHENNCNAMEASCSSNDHGGEQDLPAEENIKNCVEKQLALFTKLSGHQKAVSAITLVQSTKQLFSAGLDNKVIAWDADSGGQVRDVTMEGEVGCLVSEGAVVFVGLPSCVKVLDSASSAELTLSGPNSRVYAITIINEIVAAGCEDGFILLWRFDIIKSTFEPLSLLEGHTKSVLSLASEGGRILFSGSADHSIKTLTDHSSDVAALMSCNMSDNQFLFSGSLDKTVKVWKASQAGVFEMIYSHVINHGILAISGMFDHDGKPVLACHCNDNGIWIYDLPSFCERGRLFSNKEVMVMQIGPGIIFTGDRLGEIQLWTWGGPAQ